jgi:hypothetical protein
MEAKHLVLAIIIAVSATLDLLVRLYRRHLKRMDDRRLAEHIASLLGPRRGASPETLRLYPFGFYEYYKTLRAISRASYLLIPAGLALALLAQGYFAYAGSALLFTGVLAGPIYSKALRINQEVLARLGNGINEERKSYRE